MTKFTTILALQIICSTNGNIPNEAGQFEALCNFSNNYFSDYLFLGAF